MPLDFENTNQIFTGFSGSGFSTTNDPNDGKNKVGRFFNDGSSVDQGFVLNLVRDVDLDSTNEITLSFYSFDPNVHTILVKLENGTESDVEVKQTVPGSANTWKTVTFNFDNANFSGTSTTVKGTGQYRKLVIFIDIGETTSGTYLLDNITDGTTAVDPNQLDVEYTDLVWSDEFNTNGVVDDSKWFHQTFGPNGGRWFNNELQHYTDSQTNSFVQDGNLHIVAKKETKSLNGVTLEYTSARLNSKYAFTYGRIDVKAKLPAGNGTWPAIWTLGKNINEEGTYWQTEGFGTTSWPDCGEIDVMEHGLHADNEVSSALHTRSSFGNTSNTSRKFLTDVANDFHVYSMNWSPNQITFLIDGVGYYTYSKPSNFVDNNNDGSNDAWPFDVDQFLLLNIAMGGFSGTPDANFTQSDMVIDYVRVYQNKTASTDDFFSSKFTVYPNPATNFLNIKTNEILDKVEIFSTLGQLIKKQDTNLKRINVEGLNAGLYFVKIYSNSKIVNKEIIIKK